MRGAVPVSLSERTLTFHHAELIWCFWISDVSTGSAQDLLDERGAEPSHVGPTQSGGSVVWQVVDQDQILS